MDITELAEKKGRSEEWVRQKLKENKILRDDNTDNETPNPSFNSEIQKDENGNAEWDGRSELGRTIDKLIPEWGSGEKYEPLADDELNELKSNIKDKNAAKSNNTYIPDDSNSCSWCSGTCEGSCDTNCCYSCDLTE